MKRNTVFAAALCLMMAATVAVGAGNAKENLNPRQAGQSSIYFYEVAPTDMHGKGKLMIDLEKHTFVFNGQDFTACAHIELRAKAGGDTEPSVFAWGQVTPSGNLHIAGTWEGNELPGEVSAGYVGISSIFLKNYGWFVARLACYYSTDDGVTWQESPHSKDIVKGNWERSGLLEGYYGVPAGALVKMHAVVIGGKDRTGGEVFQYVGYYNAYEAAYYIEGVTWNPTLTFWQIGLWLE